MPPTTVVIATCDSLPELDPDDRALAVALGGFGYTVEPAVWTDRTIDWARADACIVRSTWDYHKNPEAFIRWAEVVSARTQLFNPLHVIRWNKHKFYLRDLESKGVRIVPTLWFDRGTDVTLADVLKDTQWLEVVIKPAYGASADGVLHVKRDPSARSEAQAYLSHLLRSQDVLFQPYLSSISTHLERALVFIDGVYSHAVSKEAFMHADLDHALRSSFPPGSSGELPIEPTRDELATATTAINASPSGHAFARVDLVQHNGLPHVLEVEMIEPTLYLYANPPAAQRLAHAIVRRIHPEVEIVAPS